MSEESTGVVLPDTVSAEVRKEAETIEARIKDFHARRKASRKAPEAAAPAPEADGQTPPADAAQVQPPVPAASVDPAQQTADETVALKRQLSELQKKFDTLYGTIGGTVPALKAQILDLQQTLNDLRAQRAASAEQKPAAQPPANAKPWLDGVAEEEVARYGEEFFEKIYRTSAAQFEKLRQALTESNSGTAEKLRQLEQKIGTDRFIDKVEALCPGATEINGGPDGVLPLAEGWAEFLDTPLREGGLFTRRQEAEAAVKANNPKAFADLVKEFKGKTTRQSQSQAPRVDIASQVVPASVVGHIPPTQGKRKIPQSEVDAWRDKCSKAPPGSIPLEEIERRTQEYKVAAREGRIYRD